VSTAVWVVAMWVGWPVLAVVVGLAIGKAIRQADRRAGWVVDRAADWVFGGG
jgi:hypothetical protein